MELVFPAAIVVFVLVMQILLTKTDARWDRRMHEIERKDAEIVSRVHARQHER